MSLNFFGGEPMNVERRAMVEEFEVTNEGAMFAVLSDVWLDKPAGPYFFLVVFVWCVGVLLNSQTVNRTVNWMGGSQC
jgi:hypothetical protein